MATYSKFLSLIAGNNTTIDLSQAASALGVANLQLLSTSGVLSIAAAATTATYSITMPAAVASAGQVLTDVAGTGVLSWQTPASTGANTALSNLASVAINTSLLPASANSINAGSSTLPFSAVYASTNYTTQLNFDTAIPSGATTAQLDATNTRTLASGDTSEFTIWAPNYSGINFGIQAGNPTTSATGSIYLTTGNASSTYNSGNIKLYIGTISGGTRGKIQFQDGSQGTSGYVWTSTDTNGSGSWIANSGGSAITALTGDITATGPGSAAASLVATSNGTLTTLSALTTASNLASIGTIISGTWNGTAIGPTYGGTGLTSYVTGDILYASASNTLSALPIGTNAYVLTVMSGVPSWQPASGGSAITALTGDVTASGPGSAVATLATVNSNVGSFGGASSVPSFTVNAKGLITAASATAVVAPAGTLSGTTLNSTVVASSLTSLGIQGSALNMGTHQINNLSSPSSSTDAATKGYVDSAISGLTWQGPAQAYANSNVPLTGGATLTIDGYSVQNGDLVLLANQTIASQNGEYSVSGIGSAYALTANGLPTVIGDAWLVTHGTVFSNSAFVATAIVPAATFIEFAGPTAYVFSSPLLLTGNTVSITQANTSTNGYLSSTDWNTFNNKSPAGNYATSGSGDISWSAPSGPGPVTTSLVATTNSTITTLSALTSVGTITNGTWDGSTIAVAYGGTGTTTATGTGSVVLSGSPTLTGTTSAANLTLSGNLVETNGQMTAIYSGAATLTANTTYALRWGLPANSMETAGHLYLADWSTAASFDLFWIVGLYNSTSSTTAGTSINVTTRGSFTLGSLDTAFGTADQGKPVWLGSSGTFTPNSTFNPSSGDANEKIGVATGATTIWIAPQMMGVS